MTETEQGAFFERLRQGDVVALPAGCSSALSAVPDGTTHCVVVSQTCDVVLPKRPTVILAPAVTLAGDESRLAARRELPRFVHVPRLGANTFADLAHLHAIEKQRLVGCEVSAGIDRNSDIDVRSFALAVGRWFSRFAFPDEVVPWLNPLLSVIREKYTKPSSPLGQALQDVVEFRVEAEKWSARPLDLTLHVIVRAGAIPTMPDDLIDEQAAASAKNSDSIRSPSEVASLLVAAKTDRAKATLWPLLAESFAAQCRPRSGDAGADTARAVTEVTGLLWSDDEFPLSRVRKSELLDVEYLSDGYPT